MLNEFVFLEFSISFLFLNNIPLTFSVVKNGQNRAFFASVGTLEEKMNDRTNQLTNTMDRNASWRSRGGNEVSWNIVLTIV